MRTVTAKQAPLPEKNASYVGKSIQALGGNHHASPGAFSQSAVGNSRPAPFAPSGLQINFARTPLSAPHLQCKLAINSPDDPFEREADAVAEHVMRMPDPRTSQQPWSSAAAPNQVQRKCTKCEEEEKHQLQRQETGAGPAVAPPIVHDVLSTPGQPLDASTRDFMEPRFGYDFSQVRVHADSMAGDSASVVQARAYTVGSHIVFREGQYAPATPNGRRLLAHELSHVVQQDFAGSGRILRRFQLSGVDQIALTFDDLLNNIKAIIKASSVGDSLNMDSFVSNAGGLPASAEIDRRLKTKLTPKVNSMLKPRYLMTCRCGLIDMRHFIELLYISQFVSSTLPGVSGNRVATRKGREHELTSESASRFGAEDTPSNALGAFTADSLTAIPQSNDVFDTIKNRLTRCSPIAFSSLSKASQDIVTHYYGDMKPDPSPKKPGDLIPANQIETAAPAVLKIPECGGRERSFPFAIDTGDPDRKTISGENFAAGSKGLTSDSDIRDFVATQRPEIIAGLPSAEKIRLINRLLDGWVSDEDLEAIETLCASVSTPTEVRAINKAVHRREGELNERQAKRFHAAVSRGL